MAKLPSIGQMRMPVKFEQVNKASDGTGGQDEQYVDWFTGRAYLKRRRSFSAFDQGYDQKVKQYQMWMYWRNEIEIDMQKDVRVVYEARMFSIDTFNLVDEKRSIYEFELTEIL